jgi:hypothetical protein
VESGLGAWLKGYGGFMAGVMPPAPGLYTSNDYYYYSGSASREVRNGNVEVGVDVTMNADLLAGLYVTDWHVLGGTYAAGGAFDYIWANLDASLRTPPGSRDISVGNSGIGDSLLIPFLLGWNEGNLHWNVGLNVYVPTGGYNTHELSIGKNVWGFMPQFAVTYFDPKTGLDVSATFVFTALTNNSATDYQSGDMFNIDWAIGKHFGARGEWEAGIMGNLEHQITGDSGTGAKLGPFEANSAGIGPGISYSTLLGHFPTSFTARWEHDFTAQNTFKGNLALVTATIKF